MKKLVRMLWMAAALLLPFFAQSQNVDYSCSFSDEADSAGWVFVNGTQTNQWYIGTDNVNVGSRALIISGTDSATNTYNNSALSIVYVYRSFELAVGSYYVSYDWHANGESSYDYIRVFLAPSSATFTAGQLPNGSTSTSGYLTTVPAGWIALDGANRLNMASSWQNFTAEVTISVADTYQLVFMWANDGSSGSNPPAAVDNIVFTQPTCPTPALPYVSNLATTSFDFYWSDFSDGNALGWVVEIDSANQPHGSGTVYSVSDTTITFTDLTANTDYTLYVNAVCSGYDTSMALVYHVHTPCDFLDTLPYFEDFETTLSGGSTSNNFVNCWKRINDGTTYFGYPYVSNSTSYSHNGGTKGLYWYNSTTTGTYGSYQCIALPGVDSDYASVRQLQLSFWGRATSTSYLPVLEVGVMTNPVDVTSFVHVATVNITSTEWEQFTVPMAAYTGQGAFIAVLARSTTGSWYANLDEFLIERTPACSPVRQLATETVGTTGALLTWDVMDGTASAAASFQVQVRPADSSEVLFQATVTEPRCLVTGLAPAGNYRAFVRTLCANDSLSAWDSLNFATHNMPCAVIDPTQTDTIVFSSGTSQMSGVPVNSSWGNTLCQSIYTASELNDMGIYAGMISGLDYSFTNNASYAKLFSIYITSADRTTFSGTGNMVPVRSQDLVYGPAAHPLNTSGTVHYNFTTPFMWDGSSSIIITTMMNQPNGASHSISSFYGYSTNCSATRTIYRYQDNTQYTPANSTGGNSSTSTYRPSITIYTMGCSQYATCAAPTVMIDRVDVDTVSLSWIPGSDETAWDILYRAAGDTGWTVAASGHSLNAYEFTTLAPMTAYQVRVVPDCGSSDVYAQVAFTTPCVAVTTLPFTENFENFNAPSSSGSGITQCWHRGTNYSYTNYPYLYTSRGHSGTKSMYFYSSGSYYSYLALPILDAPIDTLQVSFAAFKTSANYALQVGVMSDPDDFSTFTSLATVSPDAANTWQMFEVPLTAYSGNGQYIALATTGSHYMYVDDIEVSYLPTCPRPTNVAASSITTSTATVHWDDSAATYFMIEYGPAGFSHGNGTLITSSSDSVNLYGLAHSSPYDVYVRGLCVGDDTSNWSFVHTFNTLCGIIDSLPFSQNFDGWGAGTGARPACWSCGGYSSYPYVMNVTDDSGQVIRHTFYLYSYSSNQVYAMLPQLDSISYPSHIVQTVFRAWTNNVASTSYSHDVIVGLSLTPGDISSFTPVDTITLTPEPIDYEVAFDAFIGAGQYVTFVSTATGGASYNYVYLDSVALELIPDCQSPNNIVTNNVLSNSATISWNDRNTSIGFQVEWVLHDFAIGSGTRVVTTSNPYTITGLLPSTTYDVYVRSICDAGDTSAWSRTPHTFSTMQNPAPVPYFYDFENSTEWDNWQTCSNSTINWFRDTAAGNGTNGFDATGRYAMFVSTDSGATYATRNTEVVNATAYRDIDFGTIDSSYLLSFRAKAGGTTSAGYDGLMVFLVDPSVEVLPSSLNLETPWGNVQNMTYLAFVRLSTNWNTYTAILDTLTGIHRLAFYWFNQNTASLEGTFVGGPGAVDDIRIDYIGCPRPAGVRASSLSMASATVTWHGPDYGDYRVICRSSLGTVVASELVHTNSITISGLTPSTTYNVYVRRICSDSDSSQLSLAGTFTTLICNNGQLDTIGSTSSTTTSYTQPVATYYNYSYSQQIVTANELSGSGEISAINFHYAAASALNSKANCTIYMGHTSLSSFSSQSDFIDPASLQMVYSGNLNCTQGWNRFILETPFLYNGASNLVVAIDDNSGSFSGTAYTFYVSPSPAPMALTFYSDSENPDASSATALGAFTGTCEVFALRPQMIIETCPPNSCPTPIVREPIIRSTGVTLRWRNTGSGYQVGYRRAETSSWITEAANVSDTFYTINSLYPNTDYVYHVRQYCDSTGVSNWYTGTFNSSNIPCLSPMGLEVVSLTNRRAKFNWVPEENNLSYRLHVFNSSYDKYVTRYVHNGTVTDLEANVTYYAAVQAYCQDFDDPSAWSDTIRFTTDFCPDVSNLTYSDLQGNSVVLDWTEGGRADEWEIQYGLAGFAEGTGTTVVVDHHPYTLTGLTGETEYDIYVRAICGENFYSEHWSDKVTVETLYSGLSPIADDSRLQLYPNPAEAQVTVTLSAVNGPAVVTLMDVTGRVLRQLVVADAAAQPTLQFDLANLPSGSYFVRVTGDNIVAVRKLVVK